MTEVRGQVLDGKIRYGGRTLADWVPEVVADLARAADPLRVLLFGSVARGDDGPDSDIDLLVVLPAVDRRRRHELTVDLAHAITHQFPSTLWSPIRSRSPSAATSRESFAWRCARGE
jgi:predicted nucleotidyltransferase